MSFVVIDDFRLGMDSRRPPLTGQNGSLVRLFNGHITRGGFIQRMKKWVSTYELPTDAVAIQATGGFAVTAGSEDAGTNYISSVTVQQVELLGTTVDFVTDTDTTAAAVAAEINANTSAGQQHGYTATSSGNAVLLTGPAGTGAEENGKQILATVAGDVTVSGDRFWVNADDAASVFVFNCGGEPAPEPDGEGPTTALLTYQADANLSTDQFLVGTRSLELDGTGDYLAITSTGDGDHFIFDGAFEIEVAARFNALSGTVPIIGNYQSTPDHRSWSLVYITSTDKLRFNLSTDGEAGTTSTNDSSVCNITTDTWYTIRLVRDASNVLSIFLDGTRVMRTTVTGTPFDFGNNAIYAGWIESSGNIFANAYIDRIRIRKGGNALPVPAGLTSIYDERGALDLVDTIDECYMNGGVTESRLTHGLHAVGDALYVFGGLSEPSGMPAGVTYQRLTHPDDDTTQIERIWATENFGGLIYAIAEFTDGKIYHYYNGTRVTAWDTVASSIASNADVATALAALIDADANYDATPSSTVVTIAGANAGDTFSISAVAQNFGATNDQLITLSQNVEGGAAVSEVVAKGTVTITGGAANTAASGSFDVTGGSGGSDTLDSLKVGGSSGTELLGSQVAWTSSHGDTAAAVAQEINDNTSSGLGHGYSASANSVTVTVTAPVADGADINALSFTETVSNAFTIGNKVVFSGGVTNALTDLTVDGISIIDSRINGAASLSAFAAALDTEIDSYSSSPEYTATRSGNVVTIAAAATTGADPNGFVVSATVTGNVTVVTGNMADGVAAASATAESWDATVGGTFESQDEYTIILDGVSYTVLPSNGATDPGKIALTFKKKMYSTLASVLHFSALNNPRLVGSGIGAGFVNLSNQSSGAAELTALGVYEDSIAAFSRNSIQIEYVDEDEDLNRFLYTVENTGTRSRRSVVKFGNNDLFYLSDSGIRSIRARDSSAAPNLNDVGTPIDDYVEEVTGTLTDTQIEEAAGVIDPSSGRYMLALGSSIFVFSYFPSSKISAWSIYKPGFVVDHMATTTVSVYARSGSTVYKLGGADNLTYPGADETPLVVRIPFLSLEKAAQFKTLEGVDIGAKNTWAAQLLLNPNDENVMTGAVTMSNITYPNGRTPAEGRTTHFAMELTCSAAGLAELYNIAIHFQVAETD